MVKVLNYDVHASHCCKHYCKYAEENCPVVNRKIKAEYECDCKKQHSYKILRSASHTGYIDEETSNNFAKKVEEYLNDGWILAGGVTIGVSGGNHHILYQALVKNQ